jgi:uncharacterized coiled-coil DUF342 family protein
MSKKDDQILQLTADLVRITNDRDAKTKRMWQLGQEADKLQGKLDAMKVEVLDLASNVVRLIRERDAAETKAKDWRHFADAEKALRNRYRDTLTELAPVVLQVRQIIKAGNRYNVEAEKLSDRAEEIIRNI